MPAPLRTPQTSGHSSSYISNIPLWSLKSSSSQWLKLSFFICPRVSARFLHCFCTVSRDAMGTLTCKIRQRVQKLRSEKSRCSAQNDVNSKLLKSERSARGALLIRGPGIRVPSSAPKSHEESQDSSWDFLFVLKLHGFGTVGVIHVRLCRAPDCCAIRALFCIR